MTYNPLFARLSDHKGHSMPCPYGNAPKTLCNARKKLKNRQFTTLFLGYFCLPEIMKPLQIAIFIFWTSEILVKKGRFSRGKV